MKTLIISSENVKPSSPTPHHLQRFQISSLDHQMPPTFVPVVLYFSNNDQISLTPEVLMRSLSVILTRFYPLAGRINDDGVSINCNDQGIPFAVAKTENGQKIADLLNNPDPILPRKLVPCEHTMMEEVEPGSSVVMIQLTQFDCGGFTIGVVFWHKTMDVATISYFLKCWAHTSLSGKEPVCPNYIAQSLFPLSGAMVSQGRVFKKSGKCITRTHQYMFDAHAISTLKSEASNYINRPSRVEVVSALIWRCFMTASLAHDKSTTVSFHAVNIRRKACPPFASDCFGNLILPVISSCANIENNSNNGEFVKRIRASISKVDGGYIDRILFSDKSYLESLTEDMGKTLSKIDLVRANLLSFSSWCNFGIYDVDFGWGKPSWITLSGPSSIEKEYPFGNNVWLMDTRFADGVEAWITMDEKYMEIFDSMLMEQLRARR